ncbi:hypothetical protein CS022_17770 [Veronia nyctiphanis]|uniref:Phytoene synthase n=1 Tax=Veronia nyctiphanis TaxID=1278244 RepID=A0A4V1LSL5_9GAMM|nr:squalene/phytoene synthase family protein [Veronia nyctiphanis]RXJ72118.1 hypothetical protein CS022_17770 [Veronia nyctiphanis]
MSQEKIDLPDIVLPAKFKTGFESSDCAATSVLKQHGKSFHLAGRFLSGKRFAAAARLYAFCRQVDDIADESEDKNHAKEELALIRQSLIINKPLHPATIDVLALSQEWGLPTHSLQSLVCGVAMDLETVEIADERSLIRYCYYVAGTVGEMMCPILNSREGGTPFAIDLGIAMQMTNIARDVIEDAQMARRYLPTDWSMVCQHTIF